MKTTTELGPIFTRVLEEFAFMFAEDLPEGATPEIPELSSIVSVHFSGDQKGTVCIAAPQSFCLALYDNMVGLDDGADLDLRVKDAFKELCNVVAGQVITECFGSTKRYHLSVPELIDASPDEWQALDHDFGGHWMMVDGQFVIALVVTL
mgnify:CR=1 FL=1